MKKYLKKLPGLKFLAARLQLTNKLLSSVTSIEKTLKTLQIAAAAPHLEKVRRFTAEKQLSFEDTMKYIAENQMSFARFGDGELKMMFRVGYHLRFQKNSAAIRMALRNTFKIAQNKDSKLLLGFPNPYGDAHWSGVWIDIWDDAEPVFCELETVGNAHVSRPIFFEMFGQEGITAWTKLWDQKNVTVVTGKGSRFNLVPALFGNMKSLDFCYSTPTDAFDDLDRVLHELEGRNSDLILISLGPAGTVLAALLAERGFWALDVGHISDSYQTVFEGAAWPEKKRLTSS